MSTSFDNLVARKGSPTHSLRSGSTEASGSNRSETRDLSRQTAQQQRISQRRAIQARKIVFLVLILLLILGGLGYAIYRVVSNDSDETTTTKIKLDENDKKTTTIKTSSIHEMKKETSVLQESTRTVMVSKKKEKRYSTDHITSTFSTVKQALGSDQGTTSILNAHATPNLQSTKMHESSYIAQGNQASSSAAPDMKSSLDNMAQTTNNGIQTPAAGEHPSSDFIRKTSSTNLGLKITKTTLHQSSKTKQAIQPTTSVDPAKSSKISNVEQVNTRETKSSIMVTEKVKLTTTKNLNLKATETNLPFLSDSVTKVTPENEGVTSKVLPSIQSSISAVKNMTALWNVEHATSTNVLPLILQTSNATTHMTSSSILGQLHSYNVTTTNPLHASASAVVSVVLENGTNSSLGDSGMAATTIQPSKTFVTPVVSSSVTIPPYYHPWSNWTTCTRKCGGGYIYQTRNCSEEGQCGGLGPSVNTTICNLHKCNETVFDVSLNLTGLEWTDDFRNTSSEAYLELVEQFMKELRSLYGPNVTIQVDNISKGSVIISFTITFATSSHINNLTNAINEGKIGNLSVSLVEIVNNIVPREPDFVLVHNTTTNSTMIQWNRIQPSNANGILLGYKVTLTPGNASWTFHSNDATLVSVSDLIPNTEYTVNVFGYNVNGDGEMKTETFKTKELPPYFLLWGEWSNCSRDCGGGVMSRNRTCSKEAMCSHLGDYQEKEFCNVKKCNETTYDVSLNMTNVEWTDDLYNTSSKAYQDLLAKLLEELKKKYPNATFEVDGITKGSVLFLFKIKFKEDTETDAESLSDDLENNGLGNYTTTVNKLENTNLPRVPPGSIEVTMVTHHSAVINWLAISDEDSNGAILGYKIILIPGINKTVEFNESAKASDTEFKHVLEMLTSNTTYRFQIYGYNINGDGPKSESVIFTTKVQIPKVVSANISEITTTRALFSWQRIIDNNETYGILTGYKYIINHQPGQSFVVTAHQNEAYLDNLQPNMSYGVQVFGYNHFGDGVISDLFNFTTRVQIPKVSEAKISNITRTGSVFSWKSIMHSEESYGEISGYKIIIVSWQHGSWNMTVFPNDSFIELNDLRSGTSYNITVLGFNEYGDGIISDILQFKTRAQIPKVLGLSISHITRTSGVFSWNTLEHNEETYGEISGYKILIDSLEHGSKILIARQNESLVELQDLHSGTSYNITIFAFNAYGDGPFSDVLELKTRGIIPKPSLVSVSNITTATSKLSWISIPPNTETYGNIDGYKIITRVGSFVNNTIIRDVTSTVLRNLSSNSTYCFNVVAFNEFGDGLPSDETCFTTLVEKETVISSSSQPEALVSTTMTGMKPSSSVIAESSISQIQAYSTQSSSAMTTVNDVSSSMVMMPHSSSPPISSHWSSSSFIYRSTDSPALASIDTKSSSNVALTTVKLTSTIENPVTTPPSKTTSPQEAKTSTIIPTKPKTAISSVVNATDVEYIVGKIRLVNETFTSDLNNPETEAFKTLASQIEKMLADFFRSHSLVIVSVKVIEFRQGSVVFDFYVVTQKSNGYQTTNFSTVLQQAKTSGEGLQGQQFDFDPTHFSTKQVEPTMAPTLASEANKGLQKNDEEEDDALIVAVVICVLLFLGVALVAFYVGKKKNWFKRGKRKIVPENDDDDDDDDYGDYSPPTNDKVRLKTARAGRRSHGARINEGNTTTEC
ncbi:uncharacterized protein LOC114539003 [Dendronephthya gigantea]|uniref:uncharacterized protein LOC114539003 n=1 Tax=Dendronephthya gigantea TaxID=151771 RepID=UPI00106B764C|nr:uncharacterized protein LOC114539003 [Dendronephthya gigantea]